MRGLAVLAAVATASCARAEVPRTWATADVLAKAVNIDIETGGVRAVRPHVPALEKALAMGKDGKPEVSGDTRYVLTDGANAALLALVNAAADKQEPRLKTQAVANPYPGISLALGSYYNETGHPQDALRALDMGLALDTVLGVMPGEHAPLLINEHAIANTAMRRWPEALADYERGLKLANLAPREHALLLRGRGFCLTELSRLDDAAQAYQDSLALEPANARANAELTYIARLRAGARPTEPTLTLPNAPKPQ